MNKNRMRRYRIIGGRLQPGLVLTGLTGRTLWREDNCLRPSSRAVTWPASLFSLRKGTIAMSQTQSRGLLIVVPVLIALATGFVAGRHSVEQQAMGQEAGARADDRYALSAVSNDFGGGAFVLNTRTGQLFYGDASGKVAKVGKVDEMAERFAP
jgi:hypothetical protein